MDFLDQIAARSEPPAGGAAAAYTATLGVGLIYKVLLFELNRKGLEPALQAALKTAQKEIERLFMDLRKIIHEDSEHYERFSRETRSDDRALGKNAFLEVVNCSMLVMEKCDEALEWVRKLGKLSSPMLDPHLQVATELLTAALLATSHIVRANLSRLGSVQKKARYFLNLEALCDRVFLKKYEAMEIIQKR